MTVLLIVAAGAALASCVLSLWLVSLTKKMAQAPDSDAVRPVIVEESARAREEAGAAATALRHEVTATVTALGGTLQAAYDAAARTDRERFDRFSEEMRRVAAEAANGAAERQRCVEERLAQFGTMVQAQHEAATRAAAEERVALQAALQAQHETTRAEAADNRRVHREEIGRRLETFNETVVAAVTTHGTTQRQDLEAIRAQVEKLTESNEMRIADVRRTVDERLKEIAASNARELQEMRATVDEKLQGTLTQRLGESFALVSGSRGC